MNLTDCKPINECPSRQAPAKVGVVLPASIPIQESESRGGVSSSRKLLSIVIPTTRSIDAIHDLAQEARTLGLQQKVQILVVCDPRYLVPLQESLEHDCMSSGLVQVAFLPSPFTPGAARNIGIERSHGSYICFADDDDSVNLSELWRLTLSAQAAETDIAGGSFVWTRGNTVRPVKLGVDATFTDSLVQVAGIWRFVFLRNFLLNNDVRFPDALYGEDLMMLFSCVSHKPKFLSSEITHYTYRESELPRLTQRRPRVAEVAHLLSFLGRMADVESRSPLPANNARRLARRWFFRVWLRNMVRAAEGGAVREVLQLAVAPVALVSQGRSRD